MKNFILIFLILGIGKVTLAQWTSGSGITYTTNKVGIGTASPSAKLDVNGGLRLRQTGHTPNTGSLLEMSDRNGSWSMGFHWNSYYDGSWKYRNSDYAGFLVFDVNGDFVLYNSPLGTTDDALTINERLRITNNGNVGIGTTDPQGYKLAVNGNMIAESVKVKLHANWPDYVFEPSYKLPGLKETEQFIRENKRLPELPSAEEVEKDGLNLGEMNSKLLQKIEELTLHLIEQNKRLDAQQKEINQLKSKP